jgi:adenylate cyclase
VALFDDQLETQLEIKLAAEQGTLGSQHYQAAQRLSARAIQTSQPIHDNRLEGAVRSAAVVPLLLHNRIIGVIGALNSRQPHAFDAADRAVLMAVTSQIDTAVFERKEQRRLRSLLARAVDPKVLEHLMQRATTQILTGERVFLSVLFADIRGSTAWAAETDADNLVRILNLFYERMTAVVFKYGGTLDKYVGDQVIALFGTPVPMPDHALQAVRAAIEMRAEYRRLQADMANEGFILPPLGIGVNSGEATAGEFGARQRSDFTAIGPAVNLCARLCNAASGDEILISDSTHSLLDGRLATERGLALTLKGFALPVQNYRLPTTDIE